MVLYAECFASWDAFGIRSIAWSITDLQSTKQPINLKGSPPPDRMKDDHMFFDWIKHYAVNPPPRMHSITANMYCPDDLGILCKSIEFLKKPCKSPVNKDGLPPVKDAGCVTSLKIYSKASYIDNCG